MKKYVVLLLAIFMLAGCSTKFAYNNIDWLVYWYLDDYIELTDEQEKVFDAKLATWLQWHKENEFPQYIAHIDELVGDISSNSLSIERMSYHQEKARDHWVRLRNHVSPDLVEMSEMVSDEQVVYFFASLEQDNQEELEEFQERMEQSEEKRKKRWLSNSIDNMEEWLGKLSKEQKSFIENSYGNMESTREYWLQYKTDYQGALRVAFANRENNDNFKAELLDLLTNPEQFRSDAFNEASEKNAMKSKEFLMAMLSLSTEKQQKHLLKEITEYKEDFEDLAKP